MSRSRRIVRLYQAFSFFFSLLFWAPIFYQYQKQMGLNDTEIFGIQSLYYLAFCFLELPTGYLADRYGHRLSLRWAAVFLTVANLLPIFFVSFSGFLVHWLFVAVARSLMSGSASAYLYDYLERSGETEWYRQTEGRARALSLVGRVGAWGAVGFLMDWHITLPYWLTTLAAAVALVISSKLPEGDTKPFAPSFSRCFQVLRSTPRLWFMMGLGLSAFVLARLVQVNLFQPLLSSKGFGLETFGLIMAGTTLVEAAGSAWGEQVARKVGDLRSVFLTGLAMAVATVLLPGVDGGASCVLLTLFALACGIAYPVQRQLLNDTIPESSLRATLLSVESLIDRLLCSGMAAGVAVLMKWDRMDLVLYLSGGIALLVSAVLLYGVSRLRRSSSL